jgi:hypothetical protein
MMTRLLMVGLAVLGISGACAAAAPQKPAVNPDAATVAEFKERIDDYVAMHKKLEATLPTLPDDADPPQMDRHERALAKLIQADRKSARRGDLLTPAMAAYARRLLHEVFKGPEGRALRASIKDEGPDDLPLHVNQRYPDTVPLSTVPPQVLMALPPLPHELEYRFIGERLILLDVHAHLIADYAGDVF